MEEKAKTLLHAHTLTFSRSHPLAVFTLFSICHRPLPPHHPTPPTHAHTCHFVRYGEGGTSINPPKPLFTPIKPYIDGDNVSRAVWINVYDREGRRRGWAEKMIENYIYMHLCACVLLYGFMRVFVCGYLCAFVSTGSGILIHFSTEVYPAWSWLRALSLLLLTLSTSH